MSRRIARSLVLGALCCAGVAAAGCGGDDEREDRREIRRALIASMNASYAGDGRRACRHYTRAYEREILRENRKLGAASCEELIEAMEPVLQQLTPNPAPKVTRVRLAGERATARVEITTAFGPAASKRFLAREDDRWKITHDEDVREGPSPLAR